MPLANANAANSLGSSPVLYPAVFLLQLPLFLPASTPSSSLAFHWFYHPRLIVGIIRRTFNFHRLAFKPNEILYYKGLRKNLKRKKRRKMKENPKQIARNKVRRIFSPRRRKLHCRVFLLASAFAFLFILFFCYFLHTFPARLVADTQTSLIICHFLMQKVFPMDGGEMLHSH